MTGEVDDNLLESGEVHHVPDGPFDGGGFDRPCRVYVHLDGKAFAGQPCADLLSPRYGGPEGW